MLSSRSLLALLLPPLLLLGAAPGPAGALSAEERREMVELHNLYRAQAAAANMLRMRWDEELAAFAKAYARQCVWGHNKERGRRGENLFAITDEGMDVPLAVQEWHVEQQHYNFSAAACEPGQVCGHYTQVVWARTDRIGCGSHFCEKLQGVEETNIHLLVCNYEPPGNVKGHRPYLEGTPCSQCPSGYRCENSLCAEPMSDPEEVTETPSFLATEASDSRKEGIATSLATETSSFLVTEVSGPLATKALPTTETKASTSLAMEGPSSMATEVPSSLTTEFLPILETHSPLSLDEGTATSPKSTHDPTSKGVDQEASETTMPSTSPENSLHLQVFPTGTQGLLPPSQEKGKSEAELPSSSEVSAPVPPAQEEPNELPATLNHDVPILSKSLPDFLNTGATANAMGSRTLALQSGAEDPAGSETYAGLTSGSGHIWGPLLALLLLPPLVLAGIF
ncbi:peptidase inhibitor 16 isoform X3 [Pipistrellus kuhlii]|uniref:Peptidase inhibitor 16 n=1 Tax=Pipistrellus kuhlii TaxID=59472 RepID=A0A7J7YN16_PIPKU|nr:peptidase inhibitor 16 isoform X3 [Pipistrellus kuhlii]KAF6363427.1 peptidase inhibitor 16 [Pipistrellus kuhlii]